MAKWGEGDPRWLVEERPDATNVNNWHWTEKNASQWSKDKLEELLVGLKIEDDGIKCEITEMSKCEGEATVNNRKAKLIFFYEWEISLKWKGMLNSDQETLTGTFKVLNLSEEHQLKDVDVSVSCDSTGEASEIVREILRHEGIDCVKKQLECYLKCLTEEFSKGLILPTKDATSHPVIEMQQMNIEKMKAKDAVVKKSEKIQMFETSEIHTTEVFKCQADEFYRILTTKELIQAFTRADCILEAQVGGKFELYGGNVQGYFIDLVPNKLIGQQWRLKSWPADHYSVVKMEIQETPDCTEVSIHQTGVPRTEVDNTKDGWKRYYWQSIKQVFGLGASLF